MQTSKFTIDSGAIQKATDFVKAFTLGFDVEVSYHCMNVYINIKARSVVITISCM